MQITKNFNLSEFEYSYTAIKQGIDNAVPDKYITNIKQLCENVLQPLRDEIGEIAITSGFRSRHLNNVIKGAKKSQHMIGEAADIISNDLTTLDIYNTILSLELEFDQLILERKGDLEWVHVSYTTRRKNRKQYFMIKK